MLGMSFVIIFYLLGSWNGLRYAWIFAERQHQMLGDDDWKSFDRASSKNPEFKIRLHWVLHNLFFRQKFQRPFLLLWPDLAGLSRGWVTCWFRANDFAAAFSGKRMWLGLRSEGVDADVDMGSRFYCIKRMMQETSLMKLVSFEGNLMFIIGFLPMLPNCVIGCTNSKIWDWGCHGECFIYQIGGPQRTQVLRGSKVSRSFLTDFFQTTDCGWLRIDRHNPRKKQMAMGCRDNPEVFYFYFPWI